ncbi:tafazzin isoform X2 [Culicoides brevitarsis]|uniref:tafazzin isoform X2 n=1 Tax=Culicoides brevitarsis TaxID=469753 RepID=UPI00307BC598
MSQELDWIWPRLKQTSRWWKFCSYGVIAGVGFVAKCVIAFFNKARAFNLNILLSAIEHRSPGIPLLTVSNHHSCFDDPGMWGLFPLRIALNTNKIRWSLAAHDICFTQRLHSWFFMMGKCIPVVRGAGVYQPAIDLCIDKLSRGEWVHVFPEGKVNMTKETLRLKWGVGRMVYESAVVPLVIPIWHIGMDEILPNEPPYYFRFGKTVTYNFGQPIDLNPLVQRLRASNATEIEARKAITDHIQEAMYALQRETEALHKNC